ncbi:rhodopsin, GQ-coupled-like [Diadema antillarum]|uniref:rhodopsin, GQ-coupled-like n=1 Tax=Diadema antillarum TaxID=105358 RepID=UPI003A8C000B
MEIPERMNSSVVLTLLTQTDSMVTVEPLSNNSTNEDFVSDTAAIIMSVFLNIIAVIGIVGNSVVVLAVLFSRKLRTATNVFVIALSITDLLVCLTLPFQTVALVSADGWPLDDWLCAAIGGITSICFGASVLLLVLIAVNRFCVITRPRKSCQRFYKVRNLALMVSAAYLYPFVMFAILPIAGIGQLGYSKSYRICAWDEDHPKGEVNDYVVALTFGLSFVIIIVCYVRIYRFVRDHHQKMLARRGQQDGNEIPVENDFTSFDNTDTQPTTPSYLSTSANVNNKVNEPRRPTGMKTAVNRREVEITKNLFVVICSFFLCLAPYCVSLALPKGSPFSIFTGLPLMSNACINPIIYSFKHPLFKVVIRCLLCCRYSDIPKPSPTLKKLLKLTNKTN